MEEEKAVFFTGKWYSESCHTLKRERIDGIYLAVTKYTENWYLLYTKLSQSILKTGTWYNANCHKVYGELAHGTPGSDTQGIPITGEWYTKACTLLCSWYIYCIWTSRSTWYIENWHMVHCMHSALTKLCSHGRRQGWLNLPGWWWCWTFPHLFTL